jgi:hypothetical protein
MSDHTVESIADSLEDVFEVDRADAVRAAEQRLEEGLEKGWYRIIGEDADGRDVYQLTELGARRAESLMGLPPGSIEPR